MASKRKPKEFGKQVTNFCFTDYDVSFERYEWWLNGDWKFVVFQKEKCPKTGREHYQGFCSLKTRMGFKKLKELVGKKLHMEPPWSSVKKAIAYCRKEDSRIDGPWDAGEEPEQGKRTDLDNCCDMIKKKRSWKEIAEEHPGTFVRCHRGLKEFKRVVLDEKRSWVMEVNVYHGSAGTGKTRKAYEQHPLLYSKPDGMWFDGYDGQEAVLFDDFTGDIPLGQMLKLLDRYPMQVPVKGSFVEWVPKVIYITSNLSPEEWYPMATPEQHRALARRITTQMRFSDSVSR